MCYHNMLSCAILHYHVLTCTNMYYHVQLAWVVSSDFCFVLCEWKRSLHMGLGRSLPETSLRYFGGPHRPCTWWWWWVLQSRVRPWESCLWTQLYQLVLAVVLLEFPIKTFGRTYTPKVLSRGIDEHLPNHCESDKSGKLPSTTSTTSLNNQVTIHRPNTN